jgi:hypothetical protein
MVKLYQSKSSKENALLSRAFSFDDLDETTNTNKQLKSFDFLLR